MRGNPVCTRARVAAELLPDFLVSAVLLVSNGSF